VENTFVTKESEVEKMFQKNSKALAPLTQMSSMQWIVIRSLRWRTADCLGLDHASMADLPHFATRIEYWGLLSP
jgi:hypothetical protein